jgi:hypothetical protein
MDARRNSAARFIACTTFTCEKRTKLSIGASLGFGRCPNEVEGFTVDGNTALPEPRPGFRFRTIA